MASIHRSASRTTLVAETARRGFLVFAVAFAGDGDELVQLLASVLPDEIEPIGLSGVNALAFAPCRGVTIPSATPVI